MRRNYGKKNQKNQETIEIPGWLDGENENTELRPRDKNKSRSRKLQHSGNTSIGGGRVRRVRQPKRDNGQPGSITRRGNGETERSKQRILDGGIGDKSKLITVNFECTLQDIKDSIPNHMLKDLVTGKFDKMQTVTISKLQINMSMLTEDALLGPTKFAREPVAKRKKRKIIKPSEKFINDIIRYEQSGLVSSRVILGYYFKLYKKFYKEEDPDYINMSIQSAVITVDNMVKNTVDYDYEKVIKFIKQIMPLWYRQLKRGANFPTTRPSVSILFGGKLHFWANRKLYIKKWQDK